MDDIIKQLYFEQRPLGTISRYGCEPAHVLRGVKYRLRRDAVLALHGIDADDVRTCINSGDCAVELDCGLMIDVVEDEWGQTEMDMDAVGGEFRPYTGDCYYGKGFGRDRSAGQYLVDTRTCLQLADDFCDPKYWGAHGESKQVARQAWYAAQDRVAARLLGHDYVVFGVRILRGEDELNALWGIDVDVSDGGMPYVADTALDLLLEVLR